MSCPCHADDAPRAGLGRRAVLAGGLATGAALSLPGLVTAAGARTRDFGYPPPSQERTARPIMFPVLPDPALGKATWTDTWMAPRSGGRSHEGQDLMGPKMLKLLACVDGTVVELRHGSAGNSLYLRGDDGWYYCYLHINNDDPGTDNGANQFRYAFANGLATGSRVRRGDLVAFLGDSGNAETTGAHLHFEIRKPADSVWKAAAINPRYSLEQAVAPKLGGAAADVRPFADPVAFIVQQANDWLGGLPSWAWLGSNFDAVDSGQVKATPFIEGLVNSSTVVRTVNPVIRMYQAYFGGIPVASGVNYWVRQHRAGASLASVSQQLCDSAKFAKAYGRLDDAGFARRIYVNMYGKEPPAATLSAWTTQLRSGTTRGDWVRTKTESAGFRALVSSRVRVLSVYTVMLRRSPTQTWLDTWIARDKADAQGLRALIESVRTGAEYANRF